MDSVVSIFRVDYINGEPDLPPQEDYPIYYSALEAVTGTQPKVLLQVESDRSIVQSMKDDQTGRWQWIEDVSGWTA